MDPQLGQSDMYIPRLNTRRYSPDEGAGVAFAKKGVRSDQRWDEGVGADGGHLGSSARARRSLAAAIHARLLSLPWGRGGSQPEERHGLAAAVLRITRRRKTPVRVFFGENMPVPTIF
jgi:hypothetical protein